ncbi:MAG: conjugal transfer protein TraG N-terminal domain-containing protein [Candidatus Paracaedibacteraceae bacterium]|nr:conjugal transfer protein TraG N-terminal domain-containing protein [Candidatus Paracaedibacteraceae bacterium]
MAYDIYTYGNGETLRGIFNAIAMCVNSKSGAIYDPLIRLGMIVGFMWAVVYSLYNDMARVFTSWILPLTIITGILFVPTARVNIHDPVSRFHDSVDHVPYGLAMFAGYVNKIGYGITEQVEKHFSMPDDLKFQSTGYIFASNLMQKSNQFQIKNADLAENMHSFVNECIVYDAMLGRKYTMNDLKNTDDIWGLVSANASPVRSFMWRDPREGGTGQGGMSRPITCKAGVEKFNAQWSNAITTTATTFGKTLFGSGNLINAKAELLKYLPLTYGQLGLMSQDATNIIKQQIMISSFIKDTDKRSVALGNSSNLAAMRAHLSQRSTYQTLGAFAGDNLVVLRAVMESITYSAFIFMIFLAILPFGWRILSAWAQIVLWLQLWAPLYAILNYIMLSRATAKTVAAMSVSNSAGVTIANSVGILDANADISATAGFLAMSIPFISYALVKGVGSFVSLASHLGHVGQGAASSAAAEATSGNYSFGNLSGEGRQIGNTQMLQQSMAASYRAGAFNFADGRTEMTTMADGSQIMNVGSSNLPMSLNVAESQSAQYSAMANKSYQNALNQSKSSTRSLASSYRDMVDLSNSIGNSHQASDAISQGYSSENSKAIHKSANMITDFSKQHGISTDKAASLFAEASAGGKAFGVGGSVGGKTSVNASDQHMLQEAQRVTQSQDFQEAQRLAVQASKNYSHNLSDEKSKRLAESVSGSYEEGMQQRSEAARSYSQAESYSQQAMFTKANSASINSNYNQQFVEWLSDQRADGTSGRIGKHGASHIIANDPEMASAYANRFMSERGVIPSSSVGSSAQTIKSSYDHETGHQQYAVTRDSLDSVKDQGASEITTGKLDREELFIGSVDHQLSQQRHHIDTQREDINLNHQETMQNFKDSEGRSVVVRSFGKVIDEAKN